MRSLATGLVVVTLGGCGDLSGLNGPATPLARVQVVVTGDLAPLRPPGTEGETPHLRVALVWAAQWLPEPFCFLPADSPEADAVIQAGCHDTFGFVPDRVAANVDVQPGVPATLELFELPGADVMVGDLTARVAYGNLIVYDDRNGTGTLELPRARRNDDEEDQPPDAGAPIGDGGVPITDDQDIVYGASFVSMTMPDRRIAFREGAFIVTAFYPRQGCDPPLPGFSVLSAGGFSEADAFAAALQGKLPDEDPAMCATDALDQTVVTIPLEAPAGVEEVACRTRTSGITRYFEPPPFEPTLDGQTWACAKVPNLGDETLAVPPQLVIAAPPTDRCVAITHYVLRGCDRDAFCDPPQWDRTGSVPSWWPCPVQPSP